MLKRISEVSSKTQLKYKQILRLNLHKNIGLIAKQIVNIDET